MVIVYSSKIYAIFTGINVQTVPGLQLDTLAELNKSGLELEIDPMVIVWMESVIKSLRIVNKSRESRNQFSSTEELV